MDWADDIAYSVHDLEDFHRAGMIHWSQIQEEGELEAIVTATERDWHERPPEAKARIERAAGRIFESLPVDMRQPFIGDGRQRQALRWWTSTLIGRYIRNTKVSSGKLAKPDDFADEVRFLKQLTRRYVIDNTALAGQQFGQRRILRQLFEDLLEAANHPLSRNIFPHRSRHLVEEPGAIQPRAVADALASMTEAEVLALHKRLCGIDGGTVMNPIVR